MKGSEFILDLISELGEVRGKKALQKLVYLAKAFDIDTEYSFIFHYYGPYSERLANDFERLLETQVVSPVPGTRYNYMLNPSVHPQHIVEQQKLKDLLSYFGDKSPSDLEIYATSYFVDKNEKYVFCNSDEGKIIEKIKSAKPKYSEDEIETVYQQLKEWNLLYSA